MIPLPARLYVALSCTVAGLQAIVLVLAFVAPGRSVFAVFLVLLAITVLALLVAICIGKGHGGLRASIAILLLMLFIFWFNGWYSVMHGD